MIKDKVRHPQHKKDENQHVANPWLFYVCSSSTPTSISTSSTTISAWNTVMPPTIRSPWMPRKPSRSTTLESSAPPSPPMRLVSPVRSFYNTLKGWHACRIHLTLPKHPERLPRPKKPVLTCLFDSIWTFTNPILYVSLPRSWHVSHAVIILIYCPIV